MSQDWKRLAEAIRAARKVRGWTQSDLAEAAGIGFSSLQRLESGKPFTRMPPSVAPVERALGWTVGSGGLALAGGEPRSLQDAVADSDERSASQAARMRLPVMVEYELAHSELLDNPVIEVRPGLKVVMLVFRDPESSAPDEVASDIQAWTRLQRRLRGILAEEH
ncbi:helix-turn-helix domain-containing protein [Streptomyces sp. TBY4]|uniref:helix-turn-helix domain-containing protein n=1 Tax=Streptomyces sp. TBY4 TaxID=2962030 RepID=UPI0020B7EF53|nr:helix-turn-helix domain-containing protein [Streptomyces sp. TBY4]MCP3758175.1 helix-turn-helix domain-containing protein [Streptomyces sp. TBY4]